MAKKKQKTEAPPEKTGRLFDDYPPANEPYTTVYGNVVPPDTYRPKDRP